MHNHEPHAAQLCLPAVQQMRACRLAHQLARTLPWADSFATAAGAAAAVQLATGAAGGSNASVRLVALRLLQRLADVSVIAAAVMVAEPKPLADALVLQLLDSGAPATAQGKSKTAANAEAAKQVSQLNPHSTWFHHMDTRCLLCVACLLAVAPNSQPDPCTLTTGVAHQYSGGA